MEPHERFGRSLRRERLRRGLSQEDLGHASGLHPTEVSRLERGVREPRLSTIVALARGLGTTPSALLDRVR
jgi:transcriptional regulator with XRE-family HTH domain